MVTHNCGMPFYLHKQSRVCTASKPYFLGSGSVRVGGEGSHFKFYVFFFVFFFLIFQVFELASGYSCCL